jgi:putative nucleotidyltransferase with HDIG domain
MTQSFSPSPALPFVAALSRAASTRGIYPAVHPKVAGALADLEQARQEAMGAGSDEIQIVALDGELIVDGRPLPSSQVQLRAFARGMMRLGIESLTLAAGLDAEQCRRLVDGLSGAAPLEASSHVAIGKLQVTSTEAEEAAARELTEQDLDQGEEAFLRLREDASTAASQLDHFVWTLMRKRPRTRRAFLLPAPTTTGDRALYYHCLSVALLALAQAEALGIHGQARHDIGLAALLHDVGKLSLPPALLERRERLSDREWQVAQLHPELGAALLSGLRAVPEIAILVAYEHHWRFDGHPSFPIPRQPRTPNLASQITAVADTYDTLIASRGLDGPAGAQDTSEIWRQRAGTWLDPELVTSFIREVQPLTAGG